MIIQSLGSLATLPADWHPAVNYGSVTVYPGYDLDYATIYQRQSSVRTAISFLARNVAQLGLHVFRRVTDTDRERLADHPLAQLIGEPNPFTTRYRLLDSLVTDIAIYGNAYWYKLRREDRLVIVRIPPQYVGVIGALVPTRYEILLAGREPMEVEPADVVHFRMHNPHSSIVGLSPLDSLRLLLLEDAASVDFRAKFWQNNARLGGVISRPKDAPDWSAEARQRFRAQWEAMFSGTANAGKTAILEEGMTFQASTMTATDAQYIDSRKLTREEVAAAFHIPPPLIGIMDKATFSNIQEQHRMLYTDTLGPWLAMIEDEIELQLLPDFDDGDGIYVEFNLSEKLKGSFEEQARGLSTMVGAPMMTRNEARARLNLPNLDGADELVTPLNVLVGGQASPRDSAPAQEPKFESLLPARLVDAHAAKWADVLAAFYRRQAAAVLSRKSFDAGRWNRELGADLTKLGEATATVAGKAIADVFGAECTDGALTEPIAAWAADEAAMLNTETAAALAGGIDRTVFDRAGERAPEIARRLVADAARIGATQAASAAGAGVAA